MAEALMYENFYGLSERPFTLIPDPDFLYRSPKHQYAWTCLEYGLSQRLGFIVLTGEVGTGKTTLIKALLKAVGIQQRIGVIYQTSFGAEDLLELLLQEFEIKGHFTTRVSRLAAFNQFLVNAYSRGEHVVLIVDEAQNLGPDALEELRLLSNLQTEKEFLLQVILVGQPGLQERLSHPSLMQLANRVSLRYHLTSLDKKETKEYIVFRLARAGVSGIFTNSAIERLYEYSKGVPRQINNYAELALVAGYSVGKKEIDGRFLAKVMDSQRVSLKTLTPPEESEPKPQAEYQKPAESWPTVSENGLGRAVAELSSRLSYVEGLLIELSGQLLPFLRQLLKMQVLPVAEKVLTAEPSVLSHTENKTEAAQDLPTSLPPEPQGPRRGWWFRRWRR
jgi:general secretion pathway protein A